MNELIMVPFEDLRKEQAITSRLAKEVEQLKETNTRLNRRCQHAESAARVTVEECRRAGVSLGRALATWAYEDLRRQLRKLGGAEE